MSQAEKEESSGSDVGRWWNSTSKIVREILALVGAVASLTFILWPSRGLSLMTNIIAPMIPARTERTDSLQVVFNGERIDSLWVTAFSIKNVGNSEIVADEFQGPLRVSFGAGTRIVGVVHNVSDPESVEPKFRYDESSVLVEPMLLNSGDAFQLYAYSVGERPKLGMRSRIKGIPRPDIGEDSEYRKFLRSRANQWLTTLAAVAMVLVLASFWTASGDVGSARRAWLRNVGFGLLGAAGLINGIRVVFAFNWGTWKLGVLAGIGVVVVIVVSLAVRYLWPRGLRFRTR